jgi:hypothetical protein
LYCAAQVIANTTDPLAAQVRITSVPERHFWTFIILAFTYLTNTRIHIPIHIPFVVHVWKCVSMFATSPSYRVHGTEITRLKVGDLPLFALPESLSHA